MLEEVNEIYEFAKIKQNQVKQGNKCIKASDIGNTKVASLNLEVETLRWQLAQTEANRQMHIAVMRQVVILLSRIKERIQNGNEVYKKGMMPSRLYLKNLKKNDFQRSKSVWNVSTNQDNSVKLTQKDSSTKKNDIKSVNNIYEMKERQPSKLSVHPEIESRCTRLYEEIGRFIQLANTVLETKLPDLVLTNDTEKTKIFNENSHEILERFHNVDFKDGSVKENCSSHDVNNDYSNMFAGYFAREEYDSNSFMSLPIFDLHNTTNELPIGYNSESENDCTKTGKNTIKEKLLEQSNEKVGVKSQQLEQFSVFTEDDSGFSSISSFQEIGIPIINVIPPSPNRDLSFIEEMPTEVDGICKDDNWNIIDINESENEKIEVFWV